MLCMADAIKLRFAARLSVLHQLSSVLLPQLKSGALPTKTLNPQLQ